jgi:hypothetical protein
MRLIPTTRLSNFQVSPKGCKAFTTLQTLAQTKAVLLTIL